MRPYSSAKCSAFQTAEKTSANPDKNRDYPLLAPLLPSYLPSQHSRRCNYPPVPRILNTCSLVIRPPRRCRLYLGTSTPGQPTPLRLCRTCHRATRPSLGGSAPPYPQAYHLG